MAVFDDKIEAGIDKLLVNPGGKPVTVKIETLTHTRATGAVSSVVATHLLQKLLAVRPVALKYIKGGFAQAGQTQGVFKATGLAFTPKAGDDNTKTLVIWGGRTYALEGVKEIEGVDRILAYIVFLQRA